MGRITKGFTRSTTAAEAGASGAGVSLVLQVVHNPVRKDRCTGTLHGVVGRAQVGSIRERDHLRHLFRRYLGRAETVDHRPDPTASAGAGMRGPDIEDFEERAAIAECDGGLSRKAAEDVAARSQGFRDADHYWQWLAEYVLNRKVP